MSDRKERNVSLEHEDTILRDVAGVLDAMETFTEYQVFEVVRGGKKLFSFRVRGLDEAELEHCRDAATKMVKDHRLGRLAIPQDFNNAKYSSMVIVTATHPEDKQVIWNNKELWDKAQVLAAWQLVDKVLKPGEKDRCIRLIERLSGYEEEEDEEGEEALSLHDTLKNS